MRFILLIFMLLLSVGIATAQDDDPAKNTLDHLGMRRSYTVVTPDSYDGTTPAPLVILLHGAGGTGVQLMENTRYTDLANKSGHILVFPEGVQNSWGYLDKEEIHAQDLYTNDWDFLDVLIDQIEQDYAIDPERVYLVGFSNGGLLALRALCEYSDKLAGVAVIAATFNQNLALHCMDASPTPTMIILGTRDNLFPWAGGVEIKADGRLVTFFSAQQAMFFLAQLNGCELTSGTTAEVTARGSAIRVIADRYTGCAEDSEIRLYAVLNYRHGYPSEALLVLPNDKIGSIEDAIWYFFSTHPSPAEPEAEATETDE
jgi:polyhydroxybutyrate depolymerase